jgi:exopolyphosphatase/guanosine-5'-triphosphate,3'-diphosphate pyrophosphatase
LLIIDQSGQTLERIVRSTRLGANVATTGALSAESMQRTLECLSEYESLIKQHKVSRRRTVATAACRVANNTNQFFAEVKKISGTEPELISGEIEGALSFVGATSSLDEKMATLVIDIGGASTELMVGTETLDFAVSIPFGAVNLTEAELHRDPPRPEELTNAISLVSDAIDDVAHNYPLMGQIDRVVGVAGTIVTVAAVEVGQKTFDPSALHKLKLSREAVEDVFRTLATERLSDRVFNPGLPRDRADIIVGGCCVLVAVMRRLQISEIVVSQYNLLDGLISELRKKTS